MEQPGSQGPKQGIEAGGSGVTVPPEYWGSLKLRDVRTLLDLTLFTQDRSGRLVFQYLRDELVVDTGERRLLRRQGTVLHSVREPLLELITLVYLNNVRSFHPLGRDIVSHKDLRERHFFAKHHVLKLAPLVSRYGRDMEGFERAARYLGGSPVHMADAAYRLLPFPRVPLYYLFWKGDDEFDPDISVLFDRSIESSLSADAIWGLVTLVSDALVTAPAHG